MFRIIEKKTFTSRQIDGENRSALDLAATWLAEQCGDTHEPLHVAVEGGPARAVVSGLNDGAIVLRRI